MSPAQTPPTPPAATSPIIPQQPSIPPATPPPAAPENTYSTDETPARQSSATFGKHQFLGLDGRREAICAEIQETIVVVGVEWFTDNLLPPVPGDIDLEIVCDKVKEHTVTAKGRFCQFPIDPSKMSNEGQAYSESLEDIVHKIIISVENHAMRSTGDGSRVTRQKTAWRPTVTMSFHCQPSEIPSSQRRDNSTRPDCYILVLNQEAEWVYIGVCGEFKRKDGNEATFDNMKKISYSLEFSMAEDPRARFKFGFTIENTLMRLWYCNRARVIVSEPFNFVTDYRTVVRTIISWMFAEPAKMGWDPTMVSVPNQQFAIQVHDRRSGETRLYQTTKLESDVDSNSVHGLAQRHFTARRVVNKTMEGPEVILKDVWIEKDYPPEGSIYEKLGRLEKAQSLLLPLYSDGYVRIDNRQDTTDAMHGPLPDVSELGTLRILPDETQSRRTATGTYVSGGLPSNLEEAPPVVVPRAHYRIVVGGGYRPLWDLSNLRDIFRALSQATRAIRDLHLLQWFHRNITPSSIMVSGAAGSQLGSEFTVKLAHLQYARFAGDNDSHRQRTVELAFYSALVGESGFYSRLLDVEPMLWMTVFIVSAHDITISQETLSVSKDQRSFASELFFEPKRDSRFSYLTSSRKLDDFIKSLHPTSQKIFGPSLRAQVVAINKARSMDSSPEEDRLYESFIQIFDQLADKIDPGATAKLWGPAPKSTKRWGV